MKQKITQVHESYQAKAQAQPAYLLTPEEVAAALGFHPRSVRRAMKKKRLPGRKIGGRWFMMRVDFERLLAPQLSPISHSVVENFATRERE